MYVLNIHSQSSVFRDEIKLIPRISIENLEVDSASLMKWNESCLSVGLS